MDLKPRLKVAHTYIAVPIDFEIDQPRGVSVRSVQTDIKNNQPILVKSWVEIDYFT